MGSGPSARGTPVRSCGFCRFSFLGRRTEDRTIEGERERERGYPQTLPAWVGFSGQAGSALQYNIMSTSEL